MAKTIRGIPKHIDDEAAQEALALIEKESDRGCILVVGAWLDELLAELIRTKLLDHKKTLDSLYDSPTAPLGTFSARINVAHALCLIAEDEWDTLHKIRGLRNAAAHFEKSKGGRGFILGFEDDTVAKQVKSFPILSAQIIESVTQDNPARWWFNIAGAVLVGRFMARIRAAGALPSPLKQTDWKSYWKTFIEKNDPDPTAALDGPTGAAAVPAPST
jgi:hypothetical protein